MIKFDIGIPVYNEGKSIKNLLEDIKIQKLPIVAKLSHIFVVSDNSSDNTHTEVINFSKTNKKVKLIIKKKRSGKRNSLHLLFKMSRADILILLDGDIRLYNECVLNNLIINFKNETVGLVAGNPIPSKKGGNIAEMASFFSWVILQNIKKYNKESIYCAHGRILAAPKKLYKNLILPEGPGDDQALYLACKKRNLKFAFEKNTKVYYSLPQNYKDYLKQGIRFRQAIRTKRKYFGKSYINSQFVIRNKIKIMADSIFEYPTNFIYWFLFYLSAKIINSIKVLSKQKDKEIWLISKSTKV